MARFGMAAIRSAQALAQGRFRDERTRALVAGTGAAYVERLAGEVEALL